MADDPTRNLNRLWESARAARLPLEKDWWLNVAFYLDEQYVQWQPKLNSLEVIPRDEATKNMPRPVVNKINHFVQQRLAFVQENKPTPDAIPARDDVVAASDAEVALAYVTYAATPEVANWPRARADGLLWALTAGTGWFKWCWDPETRQPMILAPSPFEVYLDPYATDYTKARYIIHSKFMDPTQVEEQFGVEVKGGSEQQDPTRAKLLREMGQAPVLEGVTVHELWMKPNKKHPQGLYAVWTGRQLLSEPGPIPYQLLVGRRKLPFTLVGTVPRPGSAYYDSHVKYLRKPQMELNKYHSQRIQIRENFANPKWWVPDELELKDLPDNSPNQVLRGHADVAGLAPEIIQAAAMADNNEGDWIRSDMMDAVGLHEVSQGQVPGRVESSKAIELLKESDASLLHTLIDTLNESITEGNWQLLMLAKQYEKEETMVQAFSPDGVPEVKAFRARDVDPGIRFIVTTGTGLAWSRAARSDQVIRLWETGIWQNDPEGPQKVLRLLDVASPLSLSADAFAVRLARNENLTLAAGEPVKPNSWDNHEVHLREHNNYRMSNEYLTLEEDKKNKFEMHCDTHKTMQVRELRRQAELQYIAQGGEIQAEQAAAGQEGEAPAPAEESTGPDTTGQTAPGEAPEQSPAPEPAGPAA